MYDIAISDNEIHERLDSLIKRRQVDLSNVKFRNRLRTSKWFKYEASQKHELLTNLERSMKEQ